MTANPQKLIDTFELVARPMEAGDVDRLHELTIGVGWPHKVEDVKLLMELGHGLFACDPIDRVVGSAMWFPMGPRYATIGMVITSPKLQALGAGRWLMNNILELAGEGPRGLNATRAAYRLYIALGFEPLAKVHQRQGICRAPDGALPPVGTRLREAGAEEIAAILRLDRAAYGADRSNMLSRLMEFGQAILLERDGVAEGFSICRRFGRGHVVGPIVARDAAAAMALTAPHVRRHAGTFMRIDTARSDAAFMDFLSDIGLAPYDTVTQMRLGAMRRPREEVEIWGLAFHALG